MVVYPIIYKVFYFPGGCLGFLPSTVCQVTIPRCQGRNANLVEPPFEMQKIAELNMFLRENGTALRISDWTLVYIEGFRDVCI